MERFLPVTAAFPFALANLAGSDGTDDGTAPGPAVLGPADATERGVMTILLCPTGTLASPTADGADILEVVGGAAGAAEVTANCHSGSILLALAPLLELISVGGYSVSGRLCWGVRRCGMTGGVR